jgi:quercetin dioxygenase-like cupin family protein
MKNTSKTLVVLLLMFSNAFVFASRSTYAQVAKETPLITKELPDLPGKEGLVETVVLAPGEVVRPHRHNADVFAYVLEGSVITQVRDGKPQTVHAGEVFYESPTDIHIDSRNASMTRPAKLLVFFVKEIGAPATVVVDKANAAR